MLLAIRLGNLLVCVLGNELGLSSVKHLQC